MSQFISAYQKSVLKAFNEFKQTGYVSNNHGARGEHYFSYGNGVFIVGLYDTNIILFNPKRGKLKINHGGWITNQTISAINETLEILGISIRVKRFCNLMWYGDSRGWKSISKDSESIILNDIHQSHKHGKIAPFVVKRSYGSIKVVSFHTYNEEAQFELEDGRTFKDCSLIVQGFKGKYGFPYKPYKAYEEGLSTILSGMPLSQARAIVRKVVKSEEDRLSNAIIKSAHIESRWNNKNNVVIHVDNEPDLTTAIEDVDIVYHYIDDERMANGEVEDVQRELSDELTSILSGKTLNEARKILSHEIYLESPIAKISHISSDIAYAELDEEDDWCALKERLKKEA